VRLEGLGKFKNRLIGYRTRHLFFMSHIAKLNDKFENMYPLLITVLDIYFLVAASNLLVSS
jgi:hypothetical protein